jgi:hypothetical protein
MTKPFYNTINLTTNELKVENAKAKGLENTIEVVFKTSHKLEFSGWQMKHFLEKMLYNQKVNLNSVRRSMTNLKNKGVLTKTEILVMGDEGKNEHLYKLTSKSLPSFVNGKMSQSKLF